MDPNDDAPRPRPTGLNWIDFGIVLGLSGLLLLIGFNDGRRSHGCSNESSAVGALKTIMTSESVFREGDKESDGNLDYGMLSELSNATLMDSVLGTGTKHGYFFEASYSYATSEFLWFAVANPQRPRATGDRYFVTSSSGVIFYTTSGRIPIDTDTCATPTGVVQVGK